MKKSKLSIGLVTSFIGALALTACNESSSAVTKGKGSAVDIIGYNSKSEKIEINVDELYREYGESKDGTSLYYNAILESLIRYEYPLISSDDSSGLKRYSIIESEAKDKLKAVQQTAKDNAKANDTSYDEEWDKILEQNDVKSTKDLKLKFIYELEKQEMSEWYFKAHSESTATQTGLREQYLGVSEDWSEVDGLTENVDPVYPYHVLHILVKLDAEPTDYTQATISESEAKKLWAVMRQLIDGQYTFEETAKLSDDTSKDEFGDVELMTTHTSFYNEFKLGIYAFDALLSGENAQNDDTKHIYEAFGIDDEAQVTVETVSGDNGEAIETKKYISKDSATEESLISSEMVSRVNTHLVGQGTSIPTVPFDVFRLIGEKAEDEKIGTFEPEGSKASLPRNVLFNAFLNFRSPFVITNEIIDQGSVSFGDDVASTTEVDFSGDHGEIRLESNNFVANRVSGVNKGVLCDTNGNVIIGVRSTAGIHFMMMRKSVFENTNEAVGKAGTTLEDYYTTKIPTDEDFPANGETFVNMKSSYDISYYTNRADKIKDDIKSSATFDAAYDYRLYETLLDYELDTGKTVRESIHFSDEVEEGGELKSVIRDNIDRMIYLLRESHHYSQIDSINAAWQEYLLQLAYQNTVRGEEGMYSEAFIPTTCAFTFDKDHDQKDWEKGGRCYVEAK